MKKIILIISLFALFFAGAAYTYEEYSQEEIYFGITTESVNTTVGYDQSYYWYNGQTADTIGAGDSVYVFPVRKKSLSTVTPYVYIAIDSTGGTANSVTVTLESKVFEDESYTPRESATWLNGSDTVIIFQSDTAHISEYWRVKLSGADDTFKAKVTVLNWKFAQ